MHFGRTREHIWCIVGKKNWATFVPVGLPAMLQCMILEIPMRSILWYVSHKLITCNFLLVILIGAVLPSMKWSVCVNCYSKEANCESGYIYFMRVLFSHILRINIWWTSKFDLPLGKMHFIMCMPMEENSKLGIGEKQYNTWKYLYAKITTFTELVLECAISY